MYYEYSEVKNPRWLNQAKTYLECEVNFAHLDDEFVWFACTAAEDADFPHTSEIYNRCVNGEFGPIAEVTLPVIDETERVEALRHERDLLLKEYVDPVMSNPVRWSSLSESKQNEFIDYRQQLLDLPSTSQAQRIWDDEAMSIRFDNLELPTPPKA